MNVVKKKVKEGKIQWDFVVLLSHVPGAVTVVLLLKKCFLILW